MADVSRSSRSERGQLILVTALLVAVAMVTLVLLLNTAIYTENLASRGSDQSGREAVEFRATVAGAVGGLLESENDAERATFAAVADATRAGVGQIENLTASQYATRGTVARVDSASLALEAGRLIRQPDDARTLTGASGASDWDVARSVEGTRGFSTTVAATSLNETNETRAAGSDAFLVRVSGGGDTWDALVYANRTTGNVTLATTVGADPTVEHCSVAASEAAVNLSAGTLAGAPCPGYEWAEGVSGPYDLRFVNGANATGNYALTVEETGSSAYPDLNAGGPTSPYHAPAVYSATVDVVYHSSTLRYEASLRVAPGEPA